MALSNDEMKFRAEQIELCIKEIGLVLICKEFDLTQKSKALIKLRNEVSELVDKHIMTKDHDIRKNNIKNLHSNVVTPFVKSTINQLEPEVKKSFLQNINNDQAKALPEEKVLQAIEDKPTRSSRAFKAMIGVAWSALVLTVTTIFLFFTTPLLAAGTGMLTAIVIIKPLEYIWEKDNERNKKINKSEEEIKGVPSWDTEVTKKINAVLETQHDPQAHFKEQASERDTEKSTVFHQKRLSQSSVNAQNAQGSGR